MTTYIQIQDYVKQHYGFKPKDCWIAHVKELSGMKLRQAWNRGVRPRKHPCPPNKIEPIQEAIGKLLMDGEPAQLMRWLKDLEADVRYQVAAEDGEEEFRHVPGRIPVLISVPHGTVHRRKNKDLEEDEFTSGLSRLVAALSGAHVLYLRRKSYEDPNWDVGTNYEDKLKEIVKEHNIGFVMDIHGAAFDKPFGMELGTMRGKSCGNYFEKLIIVLEEHGFTRGGKCLDHLQVDCCYKAEGEGTITRFASQTLKCPAAQFEINAHHRIPERRADATNNEPFYGNPIRINRTISALVAIVRTVSG